jgi:23S rRNA pseudouridine2605 synthase
VGRLDYDAEGALLLTDDGDLANKLMHPSHQVPRVYLAKVKGVPDEASLAKLVEGVRLEDGMAHAVQAQIFEKAERNTWVKIVVTEGRQHLVKRLCAAIGHPVIRLFRARYGGIGVDGMKPGHLRPLRESEVEALKGPGPLSPTLTPLRLPPRHHREPAASSSLARDAGPTYGSAEEERPAHLSRRTRGAPEPKGWRGSSRESAQASGHDKGGRGSGGGQRGADFGSRPSARFGSGSRAAGGGRGAQGGTGRAGFEPGKGRRFEGGGRGPGADRGGQPHRRGGRR